LIVTLVNYYRMGWRYLLSKFFFGVSISPTAQFCLCPNRELILRNNAYTNSVWSDLEVSSSFFISLWILLVSGKRYVLNRSENFLLGKVE
jgi:hypothetical protein